MDEHDERRSASAAPAKVPQWEVQAVARRSTTPLPKNKHIPPPVDFYLDDDDEDEGEEDEDKDVLPRGFADAQDLRQNWLLPALDLLDAPQAVSDDGEEHIEELAERLEHVLRSFRVEAQVRREDISVGPTVIRFGIRPVERERRDERGKVILDEDGRPVTVRTRVSRIMNLRSDLALALEAHSLRMEAPVPGQPYVGLEIPRPRTRMVTLREILTSEEFQRIAKKSKLAVALGRDVSGQARAAELTTFPHVLVAGATGAGKSVCLNAFLCSLLSRATPEEVRLLLVDPKKVELTVYNGIPHLLAPVVTEAKTVPGLLKRALEEMERRYQLFSELGVRNLEGYRHLARQEPELERLPSIVIVIDELADLMMAAPEEVEYMICRLAQLARATGLHLVVATQRPSVDVITGLIKANIPTRVAFMVSSQVDSRTILDMGGAEHLLGRGDSLFLSADASKPERIQGAFVSDDEVGRLVRFWRGQAVRPQPLREPAPRKMPQPAPRFFDDDDEEPPIPPLPARDEVVAPWNRQLRHAQPASLASLAADEEEDWAVVEGGWGRRVRVPFEFGQTYDEGWTDWEGETRMPPTVEEPGPWLRPSSSHSNASASEER
jgi:DNA segregation ATPase FtsK/SpoIIIE-like protein